MDFENWYFPGGSYNLLCRPPSKFEGSDWKVLCWLQWVQAKQACTRWSLSSESLGFQQQSGQCISKDWQTEHSPWKCYKLLANFMYCDTVGEGS